MRPVDWERMCRIEISNGFWGRTAYLQFESQADAGNFAYALHLALQGAAAKGDLEWLAKRFEELSGR